MCPALVNCLLCGITLTWLFQLLPLFFPLAFFIILPSFDLLQQETGAYQRVPSDIIPESISPESSIGPSAANGVNGKAYKARLSTADKIELLKPLILQYMVPLCTVYIEEYVINSVSQTIRSAQMLIQGLYLGHCSDISLPFTDRGHLVSILQVTKRLLPILVSNMSVDSRQCLCLAS